MLQGLDWFQLATDGLSWAKGVFFADLFSPSKHAAAQDNPNLVMTPSFSLKFVWFRYGTSGLWKSAGWKVVRIPTVFGRTHMAMIRPALRSAICHGSCGSNWNYWNSLFFFFLFFYNTRTYNH